MLQPALGEVFPTPEGTPGSGLPKASELGVEGSRQQANHIKAVVVAKGADVMQQEVLSKRCLWRRERT